jgi:hypothetical protein
MKKTYLVGFVVIAIIALGIVAVPKTMAEKQVKERVSVNVKGATPESPVVYLGKKYDKQSKTEVEGYAIVHFAKNNASKPTKPSSGSTCYGFLANGAKWKSTTPEGWQVNTTNNEGLDSTFIVDNLNSDIKKWEGYAGKTILGSGVATTNNLVPDETTPDGINEVVFGDVLGSPDIIAVTIVWGVFGGNPSNRQLVEWDMIFDEVDFNWGIGDLTKMDFENIATHELGHSVGMGDLYTTGCNQETMYGYASEGQIIKRDLNAGDIAGINLLY